MRLVTVDPFVIEVRLLKLEMAKLNLKRNPFIRFLRVIHSHAVEEKRVLLLTL